MARAAVSGGLKVRRTWRPAVVRERRPENRAPALWFSKSRRGLDTLPATIDVRLAAPDGYQAACS
jgi:hypothetical protein